MSIKTRLVLIDDADLDDMKADLANSEVMDYYWRHTGRVNQDRPRLRKPASRPRLATKGVQSQEPTRVDQNLFDQRAGRLGDAFW
jgi:hypothetical protein